jgi:hypothetical protein
MKFQCFCVKHHMIMKHCLAHTNVLSRVLNRPMPAVHTLFLRAHPDLHNIEVYKILSLFDCDPKVYKYK